MKFDYCETPSHPAIQNNDSKRDFDTKLIESKPGETVHIDFPAVLVTALRPLNSEYNLNNETASVAKPTLPNMQHATTESSTPVTQHQRSEKISPYAQDKLDKSDSISSSISQNNRGNSIAPQVQTSFPTNSDSPFENSPTGLQKTEDLANTIQNETSASSAQETRWMIYPAYGQPSPFSLNDYDNPNLFGVRSMVATKLPETKVSNLKKKKKKNAKKPKPQDLAPIVPEQKQDDKTYPTAEELFEIYGGESQLVYSRPFFDDYYYQYEWEIGLASDRVTPESAMMLLQASPNLFFPFDVEGEISNGEVINLRNPRLWWIPFYTSYLRYHKIDNHVKVVRVTPTSFTFKTLKDHFDGDKGYITFTTFEKDGKVYLRQTGYAPGVGVLNSVVSRTGAFLTWRKQQANLEDEINK
jgi:hypothetical protein